MYDSPITQIATNFIIKSDEEIANGIQTIAKKHHILIDEKGLVAVLKQDQIRYEEAYNRGYRHGKSDAMSNYVKEAAKGYIDTYGVPHCSVCERVQSYGCNYCDFCGRPLLWEENKEE